MAVPAAATMAIAPAASGKDAAAAGATAAVGTISASLLRQAWSLLLPSFGLTILYLNVHLIGRYFAHSRWFVPFGAEWSIATNLTSQKMSRSANTALEYGEIIALLLLDLALFTLLMGALTAIVVLARAATHPCEFLAAVGPVVAAALGPTGIAGSLACTVIGA